MHITEHLCQPWCKTSGLSLFIYIYFFILEGVKVIFFISNCCFSNIFYNHFILLFCFIFTKALLWYACPFGVGWYIKIFYLLSVFSPFCSYPLICTFPESLHIYFFFLFSSLNRKHDLSCWHGPLSEFLAKSQWKNVGLQWVLGS